MNRYTFIGHLGMDASVRQLDSGANTISFSVAITEKWKDRSGELKESTTWVNCTIWKQSGQSTAIAQYLRKGTKVYIEGKPSVRAFTKQDGTMAASLDLRVDSVELMSSLQPQHPSPQPAGQPQYRQAQAPAGTIPYQPPYDDDLPF